MTTVTECKAHLTPLKKMSKNRDDYDDFLNPDDYHDYWDPWAAWVEISGFCSDLGEKWNRDLL